MQMTTFPAQGDSWFDHHNAAQLPSNRRLAIRFQRDDIYASLKKSNFFKLRFASFDEVSFVKLIDISSKGAAIATDVKLNVNTKVMLTITFMGSRTFEIPGKVVRKISTDKRPIYGLKFDQVNNLMANFLVNTKKLSFK